jgi:hypothetical protein
MGEYEQPRPGLGRDAAGLPGGQVSPLAGPGGLGVGEGGLAHRMPQPREDLLVLGRPADGGTKDGGTKDGGTKDAAPGKSPLSGDDMSSVLR